eukprot:2206640-Pyramimonas_sp.AAC.1
METLLVNAYRRGDGLEVCDRSGAVRGGVIRDTLAEGTRDHSQQSRSSPHGRSRECGTHGEQVVVAPSSSAV